MAKPATKIETIKKSDRRWQSDVMVDMIKRYDFEYIALNPGARSPMAMLVPRASR